MKHCLPNCRPVLIVLASLFALSTPLAHGDETHRELIYPKPLEVGDTIAFVAPAGSLDRERIELACKRLTEMGFKVRVADDLFRRDRFLAGPDAARAKELMRAFADPEVDAIFPGTGGYGTTRILDKLDYDTIRANPKLFIGFSDITALHIAIYQRAGLVTFHSPNPMYGLGSESNLTDFSARWFYRAVLSRNAHEQLIGEPWPEWKLSPAEGFEGSGDSEASQPVASTVASTMVGGTARGRLVGGNLSVVHALMGTPYEIETDGYILLLEDVGEAPYRIDRMLSTMRLAGKFDDLRGVLLGTFTRRESEDTSGDKGTVDSVLDDYFSDLGVPVIRNFPIGHVPNNATLPIGGLVELDATNRTVRVIEPK